MLMCSLCPITELVFLFTRSFIDVPLLGNSNQHSLVLVLVSILHAMQSFCGRTAVIKFEFYSPVLRKYSFS